MSEFCQTCTGGDMVVGGALKIFFTVYEGLGTL